MLDGGHTRGRWCCSTRPRCGSPDTATGEHASPPPGPTNRQHQPTRGEPDAVKAARPVRRRGPGKPTDRNIGTAPRSAPTGSPKVSPWYAERYNAAHPISGPQPTNRTCSETCFTLLRRADHLSDGHQAHLDRLFDAHPRLRTAWDALQELYGLYEADDLDRRQPSVGTLRGPLRHRPDPRIPRGRGHHRRLGGTNPGLPQRPDEQPTDPSKGSTTCSRSYAASLTGSPTPTTSQLEDSS